MLIFGLILLIIIGLLLLVVELFVLPGISVAGIASFIFLLSGIIISFVYFGSQAGIITLLATFISVILLIYFAFKPGTWNKIALKDEIKGKAVETSQFAEIKPGDTGVSVSRLAPIGEIEVNGQRFEASCENGFIDEGTKIKVINIKNNKIIIKTL